MVLTYQNGVICA